MKKLLALILLLAAPLANATQQESDAIVLDGEKCELETSWMFPSPLELYFHSHPELKYPFESSGTANYRGHVATWEVADGHLYLADVMPSTFGGTKTGMRTDSMLPRLFSNAVRDDGKVLTDWFDGSLRIFAKPKKRMYQSEWDGGTFEVEEPTEVILLQVEHGTITSKVTFPWGEYWEKFRTYLDFRKLDPKEAAAIGDHVRFLDRFGKDWENIGNIDPPGPARTEKDFEVFLTRYWSEPIRIPLSDFAIVRDVTMDFSERGWGMDYDLRIAEDSNLLMLEMGSTNIPLGPWTPFTGGSVQVLVKLGLLQSKEIRFDENDDTVKFINNFGGMKNAGESLEGALKMTCADDGTVRLDGAVRLRTKDPDTDQVIELKDRKVPVFAVEEYVKQRHKNDGSDAYFSADRVLDEIRKNSAK